MIKTQTNFPSLIKYMGSKTDIINFIEHGINIIHKENQPICDLFSGSATLSGALRGKCNFISNDIQEYSSVLAATYLSQYEWTIYPTTSEILSRAKDRVDAFHKAFPEFFNVFDYGKDFTLEEFNDLENKQQELINIEKFKEFDDYYLFTKYYSGTYWSYDQCVWIDSLRYVADQYKNIQPLYVAIMSSLMFAMAYNSQSTGHYAQYRDANTDSSMKDILIYRTKTIEDFFRRKMEELRLKLNDVNNFSFETTTLSYEDCLDYIPEGTLVYADPPYCFVHYSRFYHAIETLVKYDYPEVKFKGRYREDRHQSPFCITKQVRNAFDLMFAKIRDRNLEIVLSYSNSKTNTIALKDLLMSAFMNLNGLTDKSYRDDIEVYINEVIDRELYGEQILLSKYYDIPLCFDKYLVDNSNLLYDIKLITARHIHSTMGRKDDKSREVKEILIVAKRKA